MLRGHTRRAAEEDGARGAPCGMNGAEHWRARVQRSGLGARAVDVALEYRVPALRKVADQLVADGGIVQRQRAGQDQQIAVVVLHSRWITWAINRSTPRVRWKLSSEAQSSYRRSNTSGWIG